MSKKRVVTGQEGSCPVNENNTPENEVSCVDSVGVDTKLKCCGGCNSDVSPDELNSAVDSALQEEICVVSGGVGEGGNSVGSQSGEAQLCS